MYKHSGLDSDTGVEHPEVSVAITLHRVDQFSWLRAGMGMRHVLGTRLHWYFELQTSQCCCSIEIVARRRDVLIADCLACYLEVQARCYIQV